MLVEINQWRVTIGCFRVSLQSLSPSSKTIRPFSIPLQVLKLFWFCLCFHHNVNPCFTHLTANSVSCSSLCGNTVMLLAHFRRVHLFAKTVMYVFVEVLKRIPPGVIIFVQKKYFHSQYAYFHIACVACYTLHMQWFIFRTILLSGDVESNPDPETLTFCCWNLNSIPAYDFLRVSIIEAYNSVYNNDLIGIVETHLDSTVDGDRVALDCYSFYKDNHLQNVKIGGVGLYVKDSLHSKHRVDFGSSS